MLTTIAPILLQLTILRAIRAGYVPAAVKIEVSGSSVTIVGEFAGPFGVAFVFIDLTEIAPFLFIGTAAVITRTVVGDALVSKLSISQRMICA